MNIDTEHLHYWMCAIRESKDPKRTLDAFWRGQIQSKEWLIETLESFISSEQDKSLNFPVSIDIHGGWVGTLASFLFQSKISIKYIRTIDIDPSCEEIARTMNKKEEMQGRFTAITSDMCAIHSNADIIINTSCEHITQEQYDTWLTCLPHNSLIVVQSNNYKIDEHIRIANSLTHFIDQCKLHVYNAKKLELPLYDRYMIIGKANV